MKIIKGFFRRIWNLITEYPAVFAAFVIYIYYLLTSVDYFEHLKEKKTFFDYVLQFDSLIWMWVAAAALIQVQKYRKDQKEESHQRLTYEHELLLQQTQAEMLNDITALLQDSINNPLAIISLKTQEIRRKFEVDSDLAKTLESIESALRRIEQTIRDLRGYEMDKIVKNAAERFQKSNTPR